MSEMMPKKSFSKRRKSCPFSGKDAPTIDWKDPTLLSRYISERGKIVPSRITIVCAPKQRELAQAIKRARYMALIAPVRTEQEARPQRPDRGEFRGAGERGSFRDGGREGGERSSSFRDGGERGSFRSDRGPRPASSTTPSTEA